MKKYMMIIIILILAINLFAADYKDEFKKGVDFYKTDKVDKALDAFLSIEKAGIINADVFYNTANCYYRLGKMGMAILYYKKALKVKPDFVKAKKNLEFAMSLTKDKQDIPKASPVEEFLKGIFNKISINVFALISLLLFAAIILIIVLLIMRYRGREKTVPIFLLVLFLFIFAFFIVLSYVKWSNYHSDKNAVLISDSAIGFSGPGESYTRVFTIHEGLCFTVEQTQGEWSLIKLYNGLGGWIRTQEIKRVKFLASN